MDKQELLDGLTELHGYIYKQYITLHPDEPIDADKVQDTYLHILALLEQWV